MPLVSYKILKLFCLLLILASFIVFAISIILYPGGNLIDTQSTSFSFKNNYLCNLFNEHALNGQLNKGRYFALLGSTFLAFSFIITFYLIPYYFQISGVRKKYIHMLGLLSMLTACFISSVYHDTVINISGTLGGLALVMIFIELYRKKYYSNLILGILSILACCVTYIIYISKYFFSSLGVMQKISVLLLVVWMLHVHWIGKTLNKLNSK